MSFRLLWAGPWNERSAIGHFGTDIVRELAGQGHQVAVLRTEIGKDLLLPALPASCPIHTLGERPISELLGGYDALIVNLGDYYGFHAGAWQILRETTPVCIFHDAWMHNFVQGLRHDIHSGSSRLFADSDSDRSCLAPFAALASGAVVHGRHYRALTEAACPGPVATIPLSYSAEPFPPPRPIGDRLVVTTIGHVNRNKRADEVLRALGTSERLRSRASYMLVGPVEPAERERLLALAREVGAPEPHFTGWVPHEVLRMLVAGTDVMGCLRFPASEGGSASLITAMLSARPTLVSDHASYAEVPDGLVLKCPPGKEAAFIRQHLETILDDPGPARAMGERAREFALRTFAPAPYATKLLELLERAIEAAPAIRAARSMGRRLAEIGVQPGDPAIERLGMTLTNLLGENKYGASE